MSRSLTVLLLTAVLPACVGVPTPGEPAPIAFGPPRPMGMVVPSTDARPPDSLPFRPEDIDALPLALTLVEEHEGRLVIELPVIEVPAAGTIRTPVYRATVPFTVSLYGFAVDVVDEMGRTLQPDRLHHFTLYDPDRSALFAPLALPIFAASKESPRPVLPKFLIGVPLPASSRYIAKAMFANPETRPRRMRVRVTLSFVRPGRTFPLFRGYPWSMDVMSLLGGDGGRHDFDVLPGRSSRSWEGSPRVPGRIFAMGGHAHDYATALQLVDVTTGDTIWQQAPVRDAAGRVLEIPTAHFYRWNRIGIHITPTHTYRVTVYYDNPTGATIPFGGMGSVAGLFVPDRGVAWPRADLTNPLYRAQINNLLSNMAGMGEMAQHEH